MSPLPDPVVRRQLPIIAGIIRDETWLEGERRGCPVRPDDPVVRQKVSEVILRIGADLRRRLTLECESPARPRDAA